MGSWALFQRSKIDLLCFLDDLESARAVSELARYYGGVGSNFIEVSSNTIASKGSFIGLSVGVGLRFCGS